MQFFLKRNTYEFLLIFLFYTFLYLWTQNIPIHPDEAYYWQWSRYLDYSYYDQGPGTALWIYILRFLVGDNLRLMGILAGVLAFFFFYLYSKKVLQLHSISYSLVGLFFSYIFLPGIFGLSFMTLHDSFLLVCWNAANYFFYRADFHFREKKDLDINFFILIIFLGLGTLTKYTMVLWGISILIFFGFPSNRNDFWILLKNKKFYLGVILYIMIISPILIWNYQHQWIGLEAILFLRSAGGGFRSFSLPEYILSLFLAISPALLFYFLFYFYKEIRSKFLYTREFLFLWIQVAFVLGFFLLLSFTKEVQGNWIFMVLPGISFLLYVFYKKNQTNLISSYIYFFSYGVAILFCIISIWFFSFLRMWNQYTSYSIPYYYFSSTNTRGYKEIAFMLYQLKQKWEKETNKKIDLLANRYQDASIVEYYLRDYISFIPSLNILIKNQYDVWGGIQKNHSYLLYEIIDNPCKETAYEQSFLWVLKMYFKNVELVTIREYQDPFLKTITKKWKVYYVSDFKGYPDEHLVDYINHKMIFSYMPNLVSKEEWQQKYSSSKNLQEEIQNFYMVMKQIQQIRKKNEACTIF